MIDTGKSGYNGGKSQAEFLILKYMLDKGIHHLNSIIVTHFDNDHCGGSVDIMNKTNVKDLYVNTLNHPSLSAKLIYKTAQKQNVKIIPAKNNQNVYNKDGLKITNFLLDQNPKLGDNETSIITLIEYEKFKMLFTGDSGVIAYNKLKPFLPRNITVLKVGHHGALGVTNKDMIKYLNPKISLISVGENKFGHPALYTLFTLKDTLILRTDIDNSIKFVVNKNGYKVKKYNAAKKDYENAYTFNFK